MRKYKSSRQLNGSKFLEIALATIIFLLIIVSSLAKISTGQTEIGVSASTLGIGDRNFYINDDDPYSASGYRGFRGGPTYPQMLKSITYINETIFSASPRSSSWNAMVIGLAGACTLATNRFINRAASLISQRTGLIASFIYICNPYTYYFLLSGGITCYALLGCAGSTYGLMAITSVLAGRSKDRSNTDRWISISIAIIFLAFSTMLRPSSAIFSSVSGLLSIIYYCFLMKSVNKGSSFFAILIALLSLSITLGFHQLYDTWSYSVAAIAASADYGGAFFGLERDYIRQSLAIEGNSLSHLMRNLKLVIYNLSFRSSDFLTGLIGIRDTHSASSHESLFGFFARITTGVVYMGPLTVMAFAGAVKFRKLIYESGLWMPLCGSLAAISTSIFGCSLSRYYIMAIAPIYIVASLSVQLFLDSKYIPMQD